MPPRQAPPRPWQGGTGPRSTSLAPGTGATLSQVALPGRSAYQASVLRLNDQIFLVQSLGTRANANGGTLARRTVAIVARLASLGYRARGCAYSRQASRGRRQPGDNQRQRRVCAWAGAAGHRASSLPSSALFSMFGSVTFDRLAAHADIVLADTTLTSALRPSLLADERRCDTADPSNWGEPRRSEATSLAACRNYFPVVHVTGPGLRIVAGGRGQGVLLVDGDLDITGDFDFTGLIVVARWGANFRRPHANHWGRHGRGRVQ